MSGGEEEKEEKSDYIKTKKRAAKLSLNSTSNYR